MAQNEGCGLRIVILQDSREVGEGQVKVEPAGLLSWGLPSPGHMLPESLSFQTLRVGMVPSSVSLSLGLLRTPLPPDFPTFFV